MAKKSEKNSDPEAWKPLVSALMGVSAAGGG